MGFIDKEKIKEENVTLMAAAEVQLEKRMNMKRIIREQEEDKASTSSRGAKRKKPESEMEVIETSHMDYSLFKAYKGNKEAFEKKLHHIHETQARIRKTSYKEILGIIRAMETLFNVTFFENHTLINRYNE